MSEVQKEINNMNWEEVKAWIESNKATDEGLKAYLQGLATPTVEGIQKFLNDSTDGKNWLNSEKDKHYNKAFETWKTNNYQKEIDAEIKKRFPEADPKDLKVKELELMLQNMQKDTLKKELTNKALKVATEKKLPIEIIEFMLGETEELTLANLTNFEKVFNTHVQTLVEERIKGNSYVPPKGGKGEFKGNNPWSTASRNLTEQGRLLKEDPELAKSLMATAVK
jgi:hypothetical protein